MQIIDYRLKMVLINLLILQFDRYPFWTNVTIANLHAWNIDHILMNIFKDANFLIKSSGVIYIPIPNSLFQMLKYNTCISIFNVINFVP